MGCIGGTCVANPKPYGKFCDDDTQSTADDICLGDGTCLGTDPCNKDCQTSDQCLDNSSAQCDSGVCLVDNVPYMTTCSDGDSTTSTDICTAGICVGIDMTIM